MPSIPVDELMREAGEGPGSLIINISASPYWRNKRKVRFEMLAAIAKRHRVPVIMVNQVGGNDSLIFDGSSLAIGPDGELLARAHAFEEDLVFVDTKTLTGDIRPKDHTQDAGIYEALVLGTRDYVRKCGFSKALVGLSGGIDSALVACHRRRRPRQRERPRHRNAQPVFLHRLHRRQPHPRRQSRHPLRLVPIEDLFQSYDQYPRSALRRDNTSASPKRTSSPASAARCSWRSPTSSARSSSPPATSREMSTGYCTLYGDMVGALAVIGDVFKTRVYDLCRYVNRDREIIPAAILEKPPSAELRPGQKDTDSLPPYEVLDPILEAYVERYETPEAIATEHGFDLDLVRSVVKLVERSEYKRQQAAPVLKVTEKAFGMGRRFPIAVKVQV